MTRTAIVTGASRGIGRSIALALAKTGLRIVVASNERENNDKVVAEIREAGGDATPLFVDMTSPESIKEAFVAAGPVGILVNNAGVTKDGLAMRMKKEDWDFVLSINLTGAFLAAQQVLPGMIKERWGRIINIASVVGQSGNPGQANYVSSKAGIIGLTKALAQEVGSRNVTVNAVAPGFIETDMTAKLTQEQRDGMLAKIPLKRGGQPDDIAAAVKFLASDDASYITGHVLNVNGGMYM